jgi:predicted RNase H-like nuclease
MKYIGTDGCRGGWFWVSISEVDAWDMGVCTDVDGLISLHGRESMILIDIPIGLPSDGPRLCDVEARRMLGRPRAASVFPRSMQGVCSFTVL